MALASQRGGFSALSGFSLLALAILLAGFANRTSARSVRRGCVYSTSSADPTRPDPVRLRAPPGVRCPSAPDKRIDEESKGEEFPTEIPPGNPFVPSNPYQGIDCGPWHAGPASFTAAR